MEVLGGYILICSIFFQLLNNIFFKITTEFLLNNSVADISFFDIEEAFKDFIAQSIALFASENLKQCTTTLKQCDLLLSVYFLNIVDL